MSKNKIDKSTMEGILTYEKDDDDQFEDIIVKQIYCLKEAAICLDQVTDIHKEEINQIGEHLNITQTNVHTLGDTINHILERMRKIEHANGIHYSDVDKKH